MVVAGCNLAKAFADTLRARGYQAEAGQVNVARRQTTQDLVAGVIARRGAVHILVSSAGITRFTPFLETTEKDWDHVVRTDLTGVFFMAQAVAPQM